MSHDVSVSRRQLLSTSAIVASSSLCGCIGLIEGDDDQTIILGQLVLANSHSEAHTISFSLRDESETIITDTQQLEANDQSTPRTPYTIVEQIPDEPARYTVQAEMGEQTSEITIPNNTSSGDCAQIRISIDLQERLNLLSSGSCDTVSSYNSENSSDSKK